MEMQFPAGAVGLAAKMSDVAILGKEPSVGSDAAPEPVPIPAASLDGNYARSTSVTDSAVKQLPNEATNPGFIDFNAMLVHSPEFAADLRETMTTKKLDSPSIGESDVVEMEDEAPAKRARVGVKEKRVIAEERSAMEDTTHVSAHGNAGSCVNPKSYSRLYLSSRKGKKKVPCPSTAAVHVLNVPFGATSSTMKPRISLRMGLLYRRDERRFGGRVDSAGTEFGLINFSLPCKQEVKYLSYTTHLATSRTS